MKNISTDLLNSICLLYKDSAEANGTDSPLTASPKIQKKIKKHFVSSSEYMLNPENAPESLIPLLRHEASAELLNPDNAPEVLISLLRPDASATELLRFLEDCKCELNKRKTEEKAEFDAVCDLSPFDISSEERAALWAMVDKNGIISIHSDGDCVRVFLDDNDAFRRTLVLLGTDIEINIKYLETYKEKIIRREDKLCFCFEYVSEDTLDEQDEEQTIEQMSRTLEISFSGVRLETQVFDCSDSFVSVIGPWQSLSSMCVSIKEKQKLGDSFLCDAEREQMPLIEELSYLEFIPEDFDKPLKFDRLKAMAHQYGNKKAVTALQRLEGISKLGFKHYYYVSQAVSALANAKYEPMWRALYATISDTQRTYPKKADVCVENISNIRAEIESRLHSLGYTGSYPEFVSVADIKGLHLAEDNGKSYIVGMKKGAKCYVRPIERVDCDNNLSIDFLCGTDITPKLTSNDSLFCLFSDTGHRLATFVDYLSADESTDDGDTAQLCSDLGMSVQIAAKLARFQKLTKQEKDYRAGMSISAWHIFRTSFLCIGGFFAVFFSIATFIICAFGTLFGGMFDNMGQMLKEVPWLALFIFEWLIFGISFGVAQVISHKSGR